MTHIAQLRLGFIGHFRLIQSLDVLLASPALFHFSRRVNNAPSGKPLAGRGNPLASREACFTELPGA